MPGRIRVLNAGFELLSSCLGLLGLDPTGEASGRSVACGLGIDACGYSE